MYSSSLCECRYVNDAFFRLRFNVDLPLELRFNCYMVMAAAGLGEIFVYLPCPFLRPIPHFLGSMAPSAGP
jgi:hypothetical protein